jgi:4'-phosphopantetheinyl transferase EntD
MLASIVPTDVITAEVLGGDFDDGELLPEEERAIARAVATRRAEFTAVRVLARQALAKAGFPPAAVVPGPSREPLWPDGVVGSMTHCDGYRGCAVARTDVIAAVGIDAEPHQALPDGVLPLVATESERAALAGLERADRTIFWERILFSAKESVFKAWFPATGSWLGFQQAEVTIEPDGAFTARLGVPGPVVGGEQITAYRGHWLVGSGLILTAVVVPAGLPTSRP